MGEQDDDIYDWMLLNSGRGWQTLSKRNARQQTTNKKIIAKDQSQPKLDQQQPQQLPQRQEQYQPKKSTGFWSKLSCGLCQ